MKKQPRKLTLGRETLRELTSNEAANAQGAVTKNTFCTCQITAASCPGDTICSC